MISKCEKFLYELEHGQVPIVPSETTLKNGFDVTLINEDYTLGKVIEFYLYQQHFIADKTLSFCGFRKSHPHATDSIIRVAFHNEIDPVGVSTYIQGAASNAITAFQKLVEQMGGDLKKSERVRLSTGTMSMAKSSNRSASPKKSGAAVVASMAAMSAMPAMPDVSVSEKDKGETGESSKSKKTKASGMKINLSSASASVSASAIAKKKEEGEGQGELGEE